MSSVTAWTGRITAHIVWDWAADCLGLWSCSGKRPVSKTAAHPTDECSSVGRRQLSVPAMPGLYAPQYGVPSRAILAARNLSRRQRWRIVCSTSCHLSRMSYELFTKCVTSNVTHACSLNNFVVTNPDILEIFIKHFKIFATTWHALLHLTRIPTHTVASSSLTGTQNCVPWRKPFVVPV